MEKKQNKKIQINSKYLITVSICVVILLVLLLIGNYLNKQTYSANTECTCLDGSPSVLNEDGECICPNGGETTSSSSSSSSSSSNPPSSGSSSSNPPSSSSSSSNNNACTVTVSAPDSVSIGSTVTATANVTGNDGNTIKNYQWSATNALGPVSSTTTTSKTHTFTGTSAGNATISVYAILSNGKSCYGSTRVNVVDPEADPADATCSVTITSAPNVVKGESITLSATPTINGNTSVSSYKWNIIDGAELFTASLSTSQNPTFKAKSKTGTAKFTVEVTLANGKTCTSGNRTVNVIESAPSSSSQSGCSVSFDGGNLELAPGNNSTVTANVTNLPSDSTVAGISWTTSDNNIITAGLGSGQTSNTVNSSVIGVGYTFGSATLTVTITNSKGGSCSASKIVTVVDKDLSNNGKLTFYNNYGGVYNIDYCTFSNDECTIKLLTFTCPPNYTFAGWTTAANCGGTLNSSGKQIKLTKDSPTASRYACCKDASGGQPSGTGGGGNGGGDNGNTGDNGGGNTNTNPQTGSALIYTVWIIGIAMIGYSIWYFKQNSKIQNQ